MHCGELTRRKLYFFSLLGARYDLTAIIKILIRFWGSESSAVCSGLQLRWAGSVFYLTLLSLRRSSSFMAGIIFRVMEPWDCDCSTHTQEDREVFKAASNRKQTPAILQKTTWGWLYFLNEMRKRLISHLTFQLIHCLEWGWLEETLHISKVSLIFFSHLLIY